MSKNLVSLDFSANPENIEIGDWVVHNGQRRALEGEQLNSSPSPATKDQGQKKVVGKVVDLVENKGKMLQFWVSWFDGISKTPSPELASNLIKVPSSDDGYLGKQTSEGLISSILLVGKAVKYRLINELGCPRLLTKKQVEKLLSSHDDSVNVYKNESVNTQQNHQNISPIATQFLSQSNQTKTQKDKVSHSELVIGHSSLVYLPFSSVNIYSLTIDPHLQQRVKMNEAVIEDYANAYQEGTEFPPITAWQCGDDGKTYLVDGFHRVEAAKFARLEELPCKYLQGTYREALLYSLSVNSHHGLRRSNADKRKIVLTLLNDEEWSQLTTRELAKIANVSHQLVHNLRKEIKIKQKEIEEKSRIRAIDLIDNESEAYVDVQFNFRELPSDVEVKNKKEKTYAIEVNQTTLNLLCKYLQAEDLVTAEGAIVRLLEELKN